MKALFVWDSDYPWDIRVSKICRTLIENGKEVHLICRNKRRKPLEELFEGIHIHRVSFLTENFGQLNDIYGFPLFFSPIWLSRINNVARCHAVDLIIVRDLPMAPSALLVGKLRKIPVILDMAECYPELIRLIWKFEPFKIANIAVRNPFLADIIEHFVINSVDHIWVMIEESRSRLISKGISSEKISIVSNTPVYERFKKTTQTFPGTLKHNKDKLILLYVGFVNYSRGLDTVIESLPFLLRKHINILCVIIGTGSAERTLKDKVKELGIEDNVAFEGWIDNKLIPEYVASSDICLVPHHKCSHWDNTIPNKLFDYMAAGKPVVASDVAPIERVVSKIKCGLIFKSGNAENLAKQLSILTDQNLRQEMGKKGMKAVEEEYNWDKDSTVMLRSLQKVLQ